MGKGKPRGCSAHVSSPDPDYFPTLLVILCITLQEIRVLTYLLAVMSNFQVLLALTQPLSSLNVSLNAEAGLLHVLSMHGILCPAKMPFANAGGEGNVWCGSPLWSCIHILGCLGFE